MRIRLFEAASFGISNRGLSARICMGSVLFFSMAGAAGAQVSASLSGTVTDQSGAIISGAAITARNVDTEASRETITDNAGHYQLFSLPLGQYEVRAKKTGFA